MHQYGSSNDMMGPGSCSGPFPVFFPEPYSYPNPYTYNSALAPSSSVDCTLSLGTPSTRLSEDVDDTRGRVHGAGQERRSSISTFCWDILRTNKHALSPAANKASGRGGGNGGGWDPLLARRCANCDTTSTPLWRNGPRGPKSLCNACGIRFKKEERRATAAAATATATASAGGIMDAQPMFGHGHYGSWATASSSQSHQQKLPCFGNEFRFIEDEALDHSDNGISFLSWHLNVTDRPSGLVHDLTR